MKSWRPFRLTIVCIAAMLVIGLATPMTMADDDEKIVFTVDVAEGVIAPFPRYEVLKSPFPEFAFSPGKHLVFAKQWLVKIPVCGRLS